MSSHDCEAANGNLSASFVATKLPTESRWKVESRRFVFGRVHSRPRRSKPAGKKLGRIWQTGKHGVLKWEAQQPLGSTHLDKTSIK